MSDEPLDEESIMVKTVREVLNALGVNCPACGEEIFDPEWRERERQSRSCDCTEESRVYSGLYREDDGWRANIAEPTKQPIPTWISFCPFCGGRLP